jgi:hypothetical protein
MIHAVFADEQEVARRAGVPLEGIAAAVRGGGLSLSYLDVAAFDRFAGLSGTTFQELSHQTGIPLELLAVVREAFGFAETETAGWRSQVEGPLLASGMTGAEMLTAQAELGSPAGPHGRAGLLGIYQGQQEHAWIKDFVERATRPPPRWRPGWPAWSGGRPRTMAGRP